MDYWYLISCIAVLALINVCLRNASFILPGKVLHHPLTREIAKYLPAVVMSLLVVMCIRDISVDQKHFLAGIAGLGVVTGMHLFRRNALLSIVSGTLVYMMMIN